MQIVSSPTSPPTSIEKAATILKKEPWKASTIILSVSPDDSTLSSSTKLHNITNENIRGVSIMMTVFSIFLIVAITTSIFLDGKQSEQYVGWIAVLGIANFRSCCTVYSFKINLFFLIVYPSFCLIDIVKQEQLSYLEVQAYQ